MSALRLFRAFAALLALTLAPAAALAQASPSPYTSAGRYDAVGRVTGTISADPDGVGSGNPFLAVRNSYDGAGRLIKVETGTLSAWQSEAVAPADWTGFTVNRSLETLYDAMNRKTRDTLREGAAGTIRALTQYSYDVLGRLECTAVRMNPAVYGALPASACTLGTQGSDGPDRITRNVYDAAGQRLQLREGVGTADEGTEATWSYSANGRIIAVVDGNGNRAELHYDGYDRQDRWTFPSSTRPSSFNDATPASALASAGSANAGDYEAYGYDGNGNRTNLRKRDGRNIAVTYDTLNRTSSRTYPQGGAAPVYYSYNLLNLQRTARFSSIDGDGISNAWDGFGLLASTTSTAGGIGRTLAYRYDRNGNRIRITHPASTANQPDGNRFEMDYDGLNRPTILWGNEVVAFAGIGYYGHGAPAGRSLANGATTEWGFDGVQRMSAVVQNAAGTSADLFLSLSYNPASQIASRTLDNNSYAWTGHYAVNRAYTANGLNQYSAAGGASLSYDANGNLTADGANAYSYDVENRLVSVSGAHNAALAYDPLGRLSQLTAASITTTFLYDGDALVAEYEGEILRRRYAHWAGSDVPLLWFTNSDFNSPFYLHADQQGSIIMLSGAGTPTINSYDEYGIPAASNTGRFQYTGQAYLPEIGLYYYKARIYSPTLGRFLQTDPIGYEGGNNLYGYVGDDPVNRVDPTGEEAPCITLNTACQRPGSDAFGAVFHFFADDFINAYQNPTVGNVLWAAAQLIPVDRLVVFGGRLVRGGARLVIGKMADLERASYARNEFRLTWADRASPRENWRVNSSLLRGIMREGRPIRDVSVNPRTGELINNGGFLAAERNLLRNHGWTYSPESRLWSPPSSRGGQVAEGMTRDPCPGGHGPHCH